MNIILKLILKILSKLYLKNHLSKIIRSIIESEEIIKYNIREITQIRNADVQHYNFPLDFPIQFRRSQPFFDRYIYKMKDVNVSISKGIVSTSEGYIFQESYGSLRKLFIWDEAFTEKFSRPPKRLVTEEIYFIPHKGFYHYLLEELPALLHVLELHTNTKIGVDLKRYSSYYRDSLEFILQNNQERIILLNSNFSAENIFITQRENYSGFVHNDDINILKKYYGELIENGDNHKFEKIYISRRKSPKRKIHNEKEVEISLEKEGFTIVYLEELSFSDQIKIIGNASYVISPHGAGLSHLCWRINHKKVIEIFVSNGYNDCFARLSVAQEYDYKYVRCDRKDKKEVLEINNLKNIL